MIIHIFIVYIKSGYYVLKCLSVVDGYVYVKYVSACNPNLL